MKFLQHLVVVLLITVIFSGTSQAADPIVIKFSHSVANDTPKGRATLRFKEVVEKRTNGRVKIEIYPNNTLYNFDTEMAALLDGKVQMIAPAVNRFVGDLKVKEFEVFDLPYIFAGDDMRRRITDGPVGQDILKKLEPKGVVGLGYWGNGFRSMSANKPIRNPGDMRGLTIRIPRSQILEQTLATLGAKHPESMGLNQVREAMRTGAIDGAENTPSNFYTQKMYEVQKYFALTNHTYLTYAAVVNKKFWDALPSDIRVHIKLAMNDATRYANLYADQENNEALAKIRAAGTTQVLDLSADERAAWRKALKPVHQKMEAQIGKELIQSIYKEGASLGYKF